MLCSCCSIAPGKVGGGGGGGEAVFTINGAMIHAAAVAAQAAVARDDAGRAVGGQGPWQSAKVGGRHGPEALEGSMSLQRARAEWASLPVDDQLSLTRGFFRKGGVAVSESAAAGGVAHGGDESENGDGEEGLELIYDPNLGLYFDPKTNSFFARDALG